MTHRRRIAFLALVALAALLATPSVSLAISRQDVLRRGRVWIDAKVPYSQSRFATDTGALIPTTTPSPSRQGYRTDCSGFVSMALGLKSSSGLPRSFNTASLDDVLVQIDKEQLKPGDVILRPSDLVISGRRVSYGHAVLFVNWVDAAHTKYVGYHESSSNRGAVRDVISWGTSGFWSASGFAAYRCPLVRERLRPAQPAETDE
jgi:hypothetical protein